MSDTPHDIGLPPELRFPNGKAGTRPAADPWVKVDAAEPEIGKHYWVFRASQLYGAAVGYTDEDGVWFSTIDGDTLDGVTHFAEINRPTEATK